MPLEDAARCAAAAERLQAHRRVPLPNQLRPRLPAPDGGLYCYCGSNVPLQIALCGCNLQHPKPGDPADDGFVALLVEDSPRCASTAERLDAHHCRPPLDVTRSGLAPPHGSLDCNCCRNMALQIALRSCDLHHPKPGDPADDGRVALLLEDTTCCATTAERLDVQRCSPLTLIPLPGHLTPPGSLHGDDACDVPQQTPLCRCDLDGSEADNLDGQDHAPLSHEQVPCRATSAERLNAHGCFPLPCKRDASPSTSLRCLYRHRGYQSASQLKNGGLTAGLALDEDDGRDVHDVRIAGYLHAEGCLNLARADVLNGAFGALHDVVLLHPVADHFFGRRLLLFQIESLLH